MTNDEVTITGVAQSSGDIECVGQVHDQDEWVTSEKGKTKLDLPNLEDLSADELHQGYLTRLSTSRDMEASMVNMLKRKYEVWRASSVQYYIYIYLFSPQVLDIGEYEYVWDLQIMLTSLL